MYTGGTTGMPKGVMWEHSALYRALGGGGNAVIGEKASESVEEQRDRIAQEARGQRLLPACPLMHGTGLFTAINALGGGGAIITLTAKSLDAEELWSTAEARGATATAIVGDAFAKPMLKALQENPGRWDLSKFFLVVSSGVIFSPQTKQGLLEHLPHAIMYDSFGSSEAVGFGTELTTKTSTVQLAKFKIGPNCKVFTPDGREVEPGTDEPGYIARSGPIPLGYYKDEQKSAETFKTYQGRRWSIPGDWCTVNADGTLNLLGRGSVCINTAGEKVYPEEVEEALKTHPGGRGRAGRRAARRQVGRVGHRRRDPRSRQASHRGRTPRPRARAARRLQDTEADRLHGGADARAEWEGGLQERQADGARGARLRLAGAAGQRHGRMLPQRGLRFGSAGRR